MDQKGISYFVWTKENYQSHLFENDPKFKIILNLVKNLENSIEQVKIQTPKSQTNGDDLEDKFKDEFDKQLIELSTSIGWIPFSEIRKKICSSFDISQTMFYSSASQLIDTNPEKYEVSTGGHEGIMVRGLVHGYVRRI